MSESWTVSVALACHVRFERGHCRVYYQENCLGFNPESGFDSSLLYNSKTFYESHNCWPNYRIREYRIEKPCRLFDGFQEVLNIVTISAVSRDLAWQKPQQKYKKAISVLMLILLRKRRSEKLTADEKRRTMMLIMGCMHRIKRQCRNHKESSLCIPSASGSRSTWRRGQFLG